MSDLPGIEYGLITALVAGLVTLFDLETTFSGPRVGRLAGAAAAWWWGFILANGLLSLVAFLFLRETGAGEDWNPVALAVVAGIAYLAVIRAKLATIRVGAHEVPVGLELFYDSGRSAAMNRINQQLKLQRRRVAEALADSTSTQNLARSVRMDIGLDHLLNVDEKARREAWLLAVLRDESLDDEERRSVLATYLASGRI